MMCLFYGLVNLSKFILYVVNVVFIFKYWKIVVNKNFLFVLDMSLKYFRILRVILIVLESLLC